MNIFTVLLELEIRWFFIYGPYLYYNLESNSACLLGFRGQTIAQFAKEIL